MADNFNDSRLRRRLFSLIGEWMNRGEAGDDFDQALAEYQLIEGYIENDEYKAVVTAVGIANSFRGLIKFLISCYLVYLIFIVLGGQLT